MNIDTAELRRLAKEADMVTCIIDRRGDMGAFRQAANPAALLELLDRLDKAEKGIENMAKMSDAHVKMIYEYKERRDAELTAAKDRVTELFDVKQLLKSRLYEAESEKNNLHQQLAAAEAALTEEREEREKAEEQLEAASSRIMEINKYREEKCQTCFDNYAKSIGKLTERAEQAEASCAAMRLRFEKYVRGNCKLIRHGVADGIGEPGEVGGKCGGYAQNGDEPHYICQECVAAYDPEDEYNEKIMDAGTVLLAELQRYREALEVLSRLGNGDRLGNSDGNRIAQAAIAASSSAPAGDGAP